MEMCYIFDWGQRSYLAKKQESWMGICDAANESEDEF